jgi:hypothetical protein
LPKQNNCIAVLEVNLFLDGKVYDYKDEEYTLTVLLPSVIRGKEIELTYMDEEGNFVPVNSYINGNCVIIKTNKMGYFVISEINKPIKWWGWMLIAIAITLIIGTGLYLLYRFKDKIFKKIKENDDIIESVSEKLEELDEEKDNNE